MLTSGRIMPAFSLPRQLALDTIAVALQNSVDLEMTRATRYQSFFKRILQQHEQREQRHQKNRESETAKDSEAASVFDYLT